MTDFLKRLKNVERAVCCLQQNSGGGEPSAFSLFTQNSGSIALSGDGTEANKLTATSLVPPIQNGIISGGEVTWITGYTYSVSPAIYFIAGVQYSSPYTEITLDAADITNNRIDVFVLTTSGTAVKITGTPSTNPEQPSINTATQIQTSFALVTANTTSPVGLSQEYIYRENIEWAASATGGIVVNSTSNPITGSLSIEGTNVQAGNTLTLVRSAGATAIYATKNTLIFNLKSKATWNSNRTFTFQFKNGASNVGTAVTFTRTSFGFDSSLTTTFRLVINLANFGLTPSDLVDRLVITAVGNGGTLGFYMDDVELQGANLVPQQLGTTDNVGVFYVSKNYSGVGATSLSGYTLSDITSTNSGYNTQLAAARMGDANKAYPDPWAARNAAMMAMTAGTITRALIIINGGNTWTVGSPTASQNGSATGVAATATIPDVGLVNTFSDIHSLLKNGIDYYFNPNSGLKIICKAYQLYIGQTFQIVSNTFKSGIYGYGDFETLYGTQEGLSTRFIYVDNPWAEVTFECNKAVMQRAWMYLFNYKKVQIRMKHWIGSAWDSLVYEQGQSSDGDGLPSTLTVDCDLVQLGIKYFPYSSTGSGGTRSLIYVNNGAGGNTREENRYYNLKVVNLETWASTGTFISPQGDANVNRINERFVINVGYLKQEVSPLTTTASGPLASFTGSGGTGLRQNNTFILNIDAADITASLLDPRNNFTANASNINNTVVLNVRQLNKRATYGSFMTDAVFNIPASNQAIVGEKPKYIINLGHTEVTTGHVIKSSGLTGWTYNARVTITGTLKNTTTNPVIYLDQAGYSCLLNNVTLITAGTISIEGDVAGRLIYAKNVLSNVINSANAVPEGTFDVDPDITNYL